MDDKKRPADAQIAALAHKQHGVVAVWQLAAMGLDRRAIAKRAAPGRLHRVFRDVVGGPRDVGVVGEEVVEAVLELLLGVRGVLGVVYRVTWKALTKQPDILAARLTHLLRNPLCRPATVSEEVRDS